MLKDRLKHNLTKIKNKIWIVPTTLIMLHSKVFAVQGSIGTAEVKYVILSVLSSGILLIPVIPIILKVVLFYNIYHIYDICIFKSRFKICR